MKKIVLELPPEQGHALAQFVKRTGFDDCKRLASRYDGGVEAEEMWAASRCNNGAPATVTPRQPMSVKSDRPIQPGGCSWRNITSRLGPLSARHLAMRRSKVRRTPAARSGCRRQISSKIATARTPGAASSIGTISPSHTPASGSGRRRSRGLVFCDGNRGSASIRYAVAVENPAFAAATAGAWL